MGSVFGKLFGGLLGGGGDTSGGGPAADAVEYNGYKIVPAPRKQGGQWLTAGTISKEIGGEVKEHQFVRADTHGSRDDAIAFSVTKAQQIIDEQKDAIFGA